MGTIEKKQQAATPRTSTSRTRKICFGEGLYVYVQRKEKTPGGSIYHCPCGAKGTFKSLELHECTKAHANRLPNRKEKKKR